MINSKWNYSYLIEISETIYLCEKTMSSGLLKDVIDKMCLEIILDIDG